jgi:outer membrane protein
MRRFDRVIRAACAAGLCMAALYPAAAQSSSTPAPTAPAATAPAPPHVALVSIREAIATCAEGKKDFAALQAKFDPRIASFKAQGEEIQKLQKELATATPAEKTEKTRAIEKKQKALQAEVQKAQGEFQEAEQVIVGRISQKLAPVLDKFAKSHGYDILIDASNQQTGIVFAATDRIVTAELIAAYDQENPAKEAAPAAAKPAAAKPAK